MKPSRRAFLAAATAVAVGATAWSAHTVSATAAAVRFDQAAFDAAGVARRHLECNVVRDGVLCNLAQFRTRRDGVGAPVLDHVRHFTQFHLMCSDAKCESLWGLES